ncbi:MAG: haloacid dehalogenase-like hydrolase [Polyangiaceae bacterium]|jgi:phosphoglycolate phosphatase-like HAD superfamily hydrolase|nr:haloacid dehalogenase-like hydrolase [Polyangiaceae bacterium]
MHSYVDFEPMRAVVLFDIDGTLVTGPGASPSPGVRAMSASAQHVTGRSELHQRVEFAGRTDRQIARDLLAVGGTEYPSAAAIHGLLEGYVAALERAVRTRPYRPIGAVRDAVVALRTAGAAVGLGTGNMRRGASIKLASAGLLDLFDLDCGGYGDDAETRAELLEIGARKCDASGELPVVIVGDTPHDIVAARAIGAVCLAVATGCYDAAQLRAAGPAHVLDYLDATLVDVIRAVLAVTRP